MDVGIVGCYGAGSWGTEGINVEIVWRHFIVGDIGVDGFAEEIDDGAAAGITDGPGFVVGQIMSCDVLVESFGDAVG